MSLFIDAGYVSLNKYGEELCGDKVEVIRKRDKLTLVLADGLGSGVKANILSTLTSKILCMLASNDIPLEECIKTIIGTLPVCNVRKIAYSTFTLIHVDVDGNGYLVEFDNPLSIYISDNRVVPLNRIEKIIESKKIYISELHLSKNDLLIMTSDGVLHAGVGNFLNFGWSKKQICEFLLKNYDEKMTSRCIASLVGDTCRTLYGNKPGDDTTVVAVKLLEEQCVNLMVGPPSDKSKDNEFVSKFLNGNALRIVCGGTTSQIVSRYLKEEVVTNIDYIDQSIPPTATIKGIDLTTEGVLTLSKLLSVVDIYLDCTDVSPKRFNKQDGASRLGNLLFEKATIINIFIGCSVNKAHEGLPIDNAMKLKLVEKLACELRSVGKEVNLYYY